MTQLSLFDVGDEPALARKSDPATSHAAAEEIRPCVGKLQAAFLAALKDLGGARTAREGPCGPAGEVGRPRGCRAAGPRPLRGDLGTTGAGGWR